MWLVRFGSLQKALPKAYRPVQPFIEDGSNKSNSLRRLLGTGLLSLLKLTFGALHKASLWTHGIVVAGPDGKGRRGEHAWKLVKEPMAGEPCKRST